MVRFSLFGIPVQIQPFFWITLVIIGGALDASSPNEILQLGLFVTAGFFSILLHELGHALTARQFGAYSEITLQAFGGFAAYTGARFNRLQSFLVTAAGPATQLALAAAVAALWLMRAHLPPLTPNARYFLRELFVISLFWALLNLLPVLPLDGGRLLDALLGPRRIKITLWVSILAGITMALALYLLLNSIIFPLFLGMFAWQAYQALREIP